jgi:kumamolisin
MPTNTGRFTIPGSDKSTFHGAKAIGAIPDDERFEVTVRVRRRAPLADATAIGFLADQTPKNRRYYNRTQYEQAHGSTAADLSKVADFAREYGLVVVATSSARRSVFLSGTASAFSKAFETKIEHYEHDGGTYRGRTGPLTVPANLEGIVEGVFGIDDRPIAKPHFQLRRPMPSIGIQPQTAETPFKPTGLAKLYDFPTGVDGTAQCIGIIELGGGYRTADITTYFKELGLTAPSVTTVRIDGASNHPSTPNGPDGEVMLDIEVAAAIAPKALIAVYFAPNTDKGFLDAITTAIHDTTNKPTVISISWGSAECNWTAQAMTSFDQAFQAAASLGITVCIASGDNGSSDGVADGSAHVNFPASSPYALGCGGTTLVASGTTIASEVVWNDGPSSASGGGVSDFFALPSYQSGTGVPPSANPPGKTGRGVPDVAGDGDPNTGYLIRVDGSEFPIGGTSAVAPLWAGLIALMNQSLGTSVGYLNPLLYGSLAGAGEFHDITTGNNGAYSAATGWDPCTGWGSPDGTKLLQALGADIGRKSTAVPTTRAVVEPSPAETPVKGT